MTRSNVTAALFFAFVIGLPASTRAQQSLDLAGRWTLDRAASEFPSEIGFDADWAPAAASGGGTTTSNTSRSRRSGGSAAPAAPFGGRRESEDDAKRLKQLTTEVRNPPAHLTILDTATAVTITDDRGQARTFHPTGREETIRLESVPVGVTATREGGRLIVFYAVEQGRQIRYTYAREANQQLIVDVQFLERGGGDHVKRVYEPSTATDAVAAPASAPPAPGASPQAPAGAPDWPQAPPVNMQPGAELKGLTTLGVVVEELTPQAAACGLTQSALQTAVAKRLGDAGFRISRNSDEPTYLYVSVITTSTAGGLCISRYDAYVYSNATATLPFQQAPVLAQVSLLHKGGISGGAAAAHAAGVMRGLQDYVDQFVTQIHDANK